MLEVNNLKVSFEIDTKEINVLKNLSYQLSKGDVLALVGESGSGKSVHALALCSLLADNAKVEGFVKLEGKDLLKLSPKEMRKVLGRKIAMVFQDPMSSLNPVLTIQSHFVETLKTHFKITKKTALARAKEALKSVEIDESCLKKYPHQLSGGMRQRVMIALALCLKPQVLIADEPTTALDVSVQKQILDLIKNLQKETNTAVIFITHNLAIVQDLAKRVLVLYAGEKMEEAPKEEFFKNPLHPYSRALLNCLISIDEKPEKLNAIEGNPPQSGQVFAGCPFEPRCPNKKAICATKKPVLKEVSPKHFVACHLYKECEK